MLLKELLLTELDGTPLQQALGQLGSGFRGSSAFAERGKVDEIPNGYLELLDKGVAQIKPLLIDSQLKKLYPTPKEQSAAIAALIAAKRILIAQQRRFSSAVGSSAAVDRLAKSEKKKIKAWLENIEVESQNEVNDYIDSRPKDIQDMLNSDRERLLRAIMHLPTSNTWAEASGQHLVRESNKAGPKFDQELKKQIENYQAVVGRMIVNTNKLSAILEKLGGSLTPEKDEKK